MTKLQSDVNICFKKPNLVCWYKTNSFNGKSWKEIVWPGEDLQPVFYSTSVKTLPGLFQYPNLQILFLSETYTLVL